MNPDELHEKLREELQEKLFPINNYIPKLNEQIARISAIISVDAKWDKRLEKDKNSDRIINRIKKSELSAKDLSLYLSIIELILEGKSEFHTHLIESYEKAIQLKDSFLNKRQAAIEEAKMILNGEKGKSINETIRAINKVKIEEIKVRRLNRRYRKLPAAYYYRAFDKKNEIDYAIGYFLGEIESRGKWDNINTGKIHTILRWIKVSKREFSKWDSENNLQNVIRNLNQSNKAKLRANKNKNRWLVECLEIYQEMLVLRFRIENSRRDFYRKKYMLISDYIQNSHLAIE